MREFTPLQTRSAAWLFALALPLAACGIAPASPGTLANLPATTSAHYTLADFAHVRKYDAHVHVNRLDAALLAAARADGFELLSINVDYPDFPAFARQRDIAQTLAANDPLHFHWAATFTMQGWGKPGWGAATNASLADAVAHGARAIKVWKNVGMIEKGADGKLVMLDDPGFDPLVAQIEKLGVALIGHQGEPHNCWLPLAEMTTDNDRDYFKAHPQYHMYLHPEQPSYEDQMAARDRFLARHRELRFVGAHAASLEWSVARMARFLDAYPNAVIDLAARMSQIQYQSVRDPAKVRDFFIRYQDRVLYATELSENPDADAAEISKEAHAAWTADWKYLATDAVHSVTMIHAEVKGLALPRAVIDKLYYANAARTFAEPRAQTR